MLAVRHSVIQDCDFDTSPLSGFVPTVEQWTWSIWRLLHLLILRHDS